ncbi:hypothetical protein FOBRF1_012098 [Fusarium oxysporum]
MSSITTLLDQVNTPQLNTALAASLVEQILDLGPGHGFYAALLADPHASSPNRADSSPSPGLAPVYSAHGDGVVDLNGVLTQTLLGTLLSVALELRQKSLLVIDTMSANLGSNALRGNVLSNLPQVTSPIGPTVSDSLSLLFLGHTFCFTNEYSDSLIRWILLARINLAVPSKNDECLTGIG